jgi:hypothetical protein
MGVRLCPSPCGGEGGIYKLKVLVTLYLNIANWLFEPRREEVRDLWPSLNNHILKKIEENELVENVAILGEM